MVLGNLRRTKLWWLLGAGAACAWAPSAWPQGIYTCIDAKGRRLTSDRPIAECVDREQKQLNTSGTVRRQIGPALTPLEQAAKEEQERKAAAEAQRIADEKRRERAMLARYPNQAAHDQERSAALNAVEEVIRAGQQRSEELQEQKKKLLVETEFYAKDPSRIPAKLKREIEEVDRNIAAQQRFMANQEEEKGRVNKRFDEELARLRTLWAQLRTLPQPAAATAPAATPAAAKR